MSPANEPGLPDEPDPVEDAAAAESAVTNAADAGLGVDGGRGVDSGHGIDSGGADDADRAGLDDRDAVLDVDTALDSAAREAEEQAARERAAFDELVASFHSESAPDPVPRKIIRHPVLNTDAGWDHPIIEPTDETTVDKYFPNEHFEPPEPPPLPEASTATKASWTLLLGGVLFLVLRTLLGWQTEPWMFWLAVGGVFGGTVSLIARMRPDRDDFDDPDHGAVV